MTAPQPGTGESSVRTEPHDAASRPSKLDNNDSETRPPTAHTDHRPRRISVWVNWTLALLTVPGAGLVMLVGLGAVMSTAGCSDHACPHLGRGDSLFGILYYGAPVVALLTIAISFYTATRRRGIIVPLCGWALLAADVAVLALTFRQ